MMGRVVGGGGGEQTTFGWLICSSSTHPSPPLHPFPFNKLINRFFVSHSSPSFPSSSVFPSLSIPPSASPSSPFSSASLFPFFPIILPPSGAANCCLCFCLPLPHPSFFLFLLFPPIPFLSSSSSCPSFSRSITSLAR